MHKSEVTESAIQRHANGLFRTEQADGGGSQQGKHMPSFEQRSQFGAEQAIAQHAGHCFPTFSATREQAKCANVRMTKTKPPHCEIKAVEQNTGHYDSSPYHCQTPGWR